MVPLIFFILHYFIAISSSCVHDDKFCFCKKESVDSCLCDLDSVDSFNNQNVYQTLGRLLQNDPFKFYKVYKCCYLIYSFYILFCDQQKIKVNMDRFVILLHG